MSHQQFIDASAFRKHTCESALWYQNAANATYVDAQRLQDPFVRHFASAVGQTERCGQPLQAAHHLGHVR